MSKKKLEKLTQTHGKDITKKVSIDQILGDTGLSRYKTLDEGEYSNWLAGLNKSDLQSHAVAVGVIPTDDREILSKKLLREFKSYANNYKIPSLPPSKPIVLSDEVKSILSQGR